MASSNPLILISKHLIFLITSFLVLIALRVNVGDLEWQFSDQTTLQLHFTLPAGSYATSVLREMIGIQSPSS